MKCALYSAVSGCSVQGTVCSVQDEVCSVQCAEGSVQFAVYILYCVQFDVHCAVCSLKCAVCSVKDLESVAAVMGRAPHGETSRSPDHRDRRLQLHWRLY